MPGSIWDTGKVSTEAKEAELGAKWDAARRAAATKGSLITLTF
jgi:hypothetical protein